VNTLDNTPVIIDDNFSPETWQEYAARIRGKSSWQEFVAWEWAVPPQYSFRMVQRSFYDAWIPTRRVVSLYLSHKPRGKPRR